jgi:glycosyltransferase involved in cell wall biosynthesis
MSPRTRPAISVVIPAHNRARELPACLESVLAQTLPPDEVIVVDDRSTDDTAAVLARYAGRGVRCERLPQGRGAQAARNHGVAVARHDWIAFQDSDDLWLPHKLEHQVAALERVGFDPGVVVHGEGLRSDDGRGGTVPMGLPITEGDCRAELLCRPGPMFQALLVSREALARAGGLDPDCPSYQEWDTAIRLSLHCRFVHLREPLFVWVRHAGETISRDGQRAVTGYDYVTGRHRDAILALHGPRGWRRLRIENVARAMRAGLWPEARRLLDAEPPHLCFALARLLVSLKLAPRGVGRVLRLAA